MKTKSFGAKSFAINLSMCSALTIAIALATTQTAIAQTTATETKTTRTTKVVPTSQPATNQDSELPQTPPFTQDITQTPGITPAPPLTSAQAPIDKKASKMRSRVNRGTSSMQFHFIYSPLDLFIPQKIGVSGSYIHTAQYTYEFEYLRGKIAAPSFFKDLGSMTDEKISLMARNYFARNSFNLSYGLTYFRFKVHLGSEYLQGVTASERANFDVLNLESVGLNIGVGNRWAVTEHISFGVDWIELYQPLIETKSETGFVDETNDNSDRKAVEDALDYIAKFPRFTLFKVSLGATF